MKKQTIKKYAAILLGSCILAFGLFNIHSRTLISEGGVLGLSLLVHHWFHISPGISCFVIDCTCFLIGTAVLGKYFFRDSVIASASYSLWYLLFEAIGPVLPDLSSMLPLAAVLGAVFVGVGVGFIVRYDCAAGGDDALALVFHKLTKWKVSVFYVLSDCTILLLSLSYIPFSQIVWSLLSVMLSSTIIEFLRPKGA
ncbi:MAG: YitT family protein [Oscillospiraceae bacterium]|nr:YitT family protein [Oscillospiraceae bacterium]